MTKKENIMNDPDFKLLRKKQAELSKLGSKHKKGSKPSRIKNLTQFKTDEEIRAWEEAHAPVQPPVQLDLFPKYDPEVAAMPNTIARSSLFAPIARGRRRFLENAMIASRSDATITFTGLQLDMGDSDVFLQAIRLATVYDLGTEFQILPHSFLRAIGRGGKTKTGKVHRQWLQKSLSRLKTGNLIIDTEKYRAMLSLVDEYFFDKKKGVHQLRINPKIISLFGREQYGLIDWDKRKSISVDLAKWLQTYVASNKRGSQKISIQKIKEWSGQKARRMDHFKKTLKKALKQLEDLRIIKTVSISKKDILKYTRL